jgi:cell wall-associated NlpC family hydrolase
MVSQLSKIGFIVYFSFILSNNSFSGTPDNVETKKSEASTLSGVSISYENTIMATNKSLVFVNSSKVAITSDLENEVAHSSVESKPDLRQVLYNPIKSDSLAIVRTKLISMAEEYLGLRYRRGGTSVKGFDCSGYTQYLFKNVTGVTLPRSSHDQSLMGEEINLTDAKVGDFIFFGSKKGKRFHTNHVGMVYANHNGIVKMIHSSRHGIMIESTNSNSWKSYYKRRFLFVKRVLF